MNYSQVVDAALKYADRLEDPEVLSSVDNMLRVVESRFNEMTLVMASTTRVFVPITDASVELYSLPSGFSSFRSIALSTAVDSTAKRVTLELVSPQIMVDYQSAGATGNYYCIIAGQVQIFSPSKIAGSYIEYVYYGSLTALVEGQNNWLSDKFPDVYIFGLTAEVCAKTKDWEAFDRWDARFQSAVNSISLQDDLMTWSGTPITMRAG